MNPPLTKLTVAEMAGHRCACDGQATHRAGARFYCRGCVAELEGRANRTRWRNPNAAFLSQPEGQRHGRARTSS